MELRDLLIKLYKERSKEEMVLLLEQFNDCPSDNNFHREETHVDCEGKCSDCYIKSIEYEISRTIEDKAREELIIELQNVFKILMHNTMSHEAMLHALDDLSSSLSIFQAVLKVEESE